MVRTDSQTGTPVTLVVSPGQTTPVSTPPGHKPIPFTGFELVPAFVLAAFLLALGAVLTAAARPR